MTTSRNVRRRVWLIIAFDLIVMVVIDIAPRSVVWGFVALLGLGLLLFLGGLLALVLLAGRSQSQSLGKMVLRRSRSNRRPMLPQLPPREKAADREPPRH